MIGQEGVDGVGGPWRHCISEPLTDHTLLYKNNGITSKQYRKCGPEWRLTGQENTSGSDNQTRYKQTWSLEEKTKENVKSICSKCPLIIF